MPSMKRFKASILNRTKSSGSGGGSGASDAVTDDTPEGRAEQAVRRFCESGGTGNSQGEEVLHLPVIVEAAESSPGAASAAAHLIRKFMSKDNANRPNVQYNAIMLLRILAENPGPAFTRYINGKFVDTTAYLLRTGTDPSVQQILRETLDALDMERHNDAGLKKLLEMWRMNRGFNTQFMVPSQYRPGGHSGSISHSGPQRMTLPTPVELASRIEESKNSAKILIQLVQSTPPDEVLDNDLVKEFAERCQNAQRSLQGYIGCDNPAPDPDTLQTLIETSEQLSLSLSKHQRAKLGARRTLGLAAGSATGSPAPESQSRFGGPPPIPAKTGASPGPDFQNRFGATPIPGNTTASPTPPLISLADPSPQTSRGPSISAPSQVSAPSQFSMPPQMSASPRVDVPEEKEVVVHPAHDPFSDNAERSTWQSDSQPQPRRSVYNNTAVELPTVMSGANGPAPGPAPQPVYRY